MDFGVEDREPSPVVGETVTILGGDAGDEFVEPKPGRVVAGLIHRVGRTAEQSGHQEQTCAVNVRVKYFARLRTPEIEGLKSTR